MNAHFGELLIEFPIREICYASGVFWIAGSLQGLTGFGFNLLSVPALVLWFPAQVVVPGVLLSYLPLGIGQFVQLRRDVDGLILGTIVGSAIVGMPLGAFLLRDTDAEVMKRAIGLAMVGVGHFFASAAGPPVQTRRADLCRRGHVQRFFVVEYWRVRAALGSVWAETALAPCDDARDAFDLLFLYFRAEFGRVVAGGRCDV